MISESKFDKQGVFTEPMTLPTQPDLRESEESDWSEAGEDNLNQPTPTRACDFSEYVPLIFAQGLNKAEHLQNLLEDHGIPTLVESGENDLSSLAVLSRRVPLLVPEEMLDEASELIIKIAEQSAGGSGDDEDDSFDDDEDDDIDDDDDDDDDMLDDEDEDDDF